MPDFFGVYDNLNVTEYMDFYGSMYGMSSRDIAKISDDLLELVNLSDKKEVYVDTLSRGMKQRLCVARALIHNPALLVLDEPNSGLDPRARVEMKELLLNLKSMGKTIVISSHILSELSEMCNSIGIMNRGHLVTAGKIDDVMSQVFGNYHYGRGRYGTGSAYAQRTCKCQSRICGRKGDPHFPQPDTDGDCTADCGTDRQRNSCDRIPYAGRKLRGIVYGADRRCRKCD